MHGFALWLGNLLRWFIRRAVRFYYPTIEITGREKIPADVPVLFVANHANSLMDPVLVGIASGRPVHFLAKAPLFQVPVFGAFLRGFGMIPAYRGSDDPTQVGGNLQSLTLAAEFLVKGECVGIFPEGKSHDALKVDKVRTGAARIAVQAVQLGSKKLVIIPLGLNYERKEKFRSSLWVRVGEPILLADWQAKIAEEERTAMRALTAEIDRQLKAVVIHLDEDKWESFVPDLESLVPPVGKSRLTPIAALRQRKRIADGMNHYLATDRPQAEALATEILAHREQLDALNLTMQSDLFRLRYLKLFVRQTVDILRLAIGLVPALLGTIFNGLPYLIVRLLAKALPDRSKTTTALKRLGLGFLIFPVWYGIADWRLAQYFVPGFTITLSLVACACGIYAMTYWPRARRQGHLWWTELLLILQKEKLSRLRAEHIRLQRKLEALVMAYRQLHPAEAAAPPFPWAWYLKRLGGWGVSAALVFSIGYAVVWEWRESQLTVLQQPGLALGRLSPAQLGAFLKEDEPQLLEIVQGLTALEGKALRLQQELAGQQRGFYRQEDNDAIRQNLFAYVTYRTELLRLIWKYQDYAAVSDETLRARTFLLELAAASALYETSFKLVTRFAATPEAVRKLNEGEPLWEIPEGLYDLVRANLIATKNRRMLAEALAAYDQTKPDFARLGLQAEAPYAQFHQVIAESRAVTAPLDELAKQWNVSMPVEKAEQLGKKTIYKGQSWISTWVGNTRVRQPRAGKPLIQPEQLEKLRTQLQPGDILLERQNWYLSRAFMPGYWAHAAIYVGTTNDLVRLGLDRDPRVQKFWEEFAARDAAGHEHVILEAVPSGVRITTLEHCLGVADSAAVLRPKIAPGQMPEVIAQAFIHLGKPYDFEFDFFSTDKLVCTELVYRCCDKQVQFPLVDVMGRKTLPPTEVVHKFADELGKGAAQLEFVAFLDGEESQGKARFRDAAALAESIHRPSMTWLQER